MTWKQIERMRETRLWITQVVVPIVGFGAMIAADPIARDAVKARVEKVKRSIKKRKIKIVKEEEES